MGGKGEGGHGAKEPFSEYNTQLAPAQLTTTELDGH